MPISRARLGVFAFGLLSLGVAANVLTQPKPHRLLAQKTSSVTGDVASNFPQVTVTNADPTITVRMQKDGRPVDTDGAPSDTVRAVQRELQARGYEPGAQDGVPGLVTRAAVLAFEEDHGLSPTAEPSEEVLKAILLGGAGFSTAPGAAARGASRQGYEQVVRAVQLQLAALGYINGRPDGVLGPDTARAIREFEMDQGTKPTGRITGPLMARLTKAAASRRPVAAR